MRGCESCALPRSREVCGSTGDELEKEAGDEDCQEAGVGMVGLACVGSVGGGGGG